MSDLIPSEFISLLDWGVSHPKASFFERVAYFSHFFLGKPYLAGALGEGPRGEIDKNPFIRVDSFDCVTFVNTVLALAHANKVVELQFHLARLGYKDAKICYENRHHFMSCDWNVENVRLGYLYEITPEVKDTKGLPCYELAHALIDKPAWFHKMAPSLLKKQKFQKVQAYIPYLPFSALLSLKREVNTQLFDQFPEVSIVELVCPNWNLKKEIGTHLNVSHIGFLILKEGRYLFRHASRQQGVVIEECFIGYLKRLVPSQVVKGINVQGLVF